MATSRMTEQLGRVLGGRYRLVAPIGTGASAQVFLADDVKLRRRVALKVLHPALADDQAFLRRFRAEARAAAALSHPNLMAVYDWSDEDPYLVLEYLGGGSLRALLDRGRHLSVAQAVVVGLEAARALDYAHTKGFVHRDIKPANLLFGDEGRLRIADFGLARALSEATWTEPGDGLIGTARYAAPEQASGARVDGKADVYALGLVLIESVTGTVPLTAETALPTLLRRVDSAVPVPAAMGPLVSVLADVGQPDPARRPTSAEMGRALLAVARRLDRPDPLPLPGAIEVSALRELEEVDLTLLPEPVVVPDRPPEVLDDVPAVVSATDGEDGDGGESSSPRRRRWPRIVVALVLLALAAGVAAFAWQTTRPPTFAMPRVTGLTADQADIALNDAQADGELSWSVEPERAFSEDVRKGEVISQDPEPGEQLEEGGAATYVVSRGKPFVALPDLTSRTEPLARTELEGVDLSVGAVTQAFHEEVPPGTIITWGAAGSDRPAELRQGSAVDLVISQGPEPRTIPGLAGRTPEQATAALTELGLEVTARQQSSDAAAGRVIGTIPSSGTSVQRGTTVTIVVSSGPPLIAVPDVTGTTGREAKRELEAQGFVVAAIQGPRGGFAYSTNPPAGASVARGTAVTILTI